MPSPSFATAGSISAVHSDVTKTHLLHVISSFVINGPCCFFSDSFTIPDNVANGELSQPLILTKHINSKVTSIKPFDFSQPFRVDLVYSVVPSSTTRVVNSKRAWRSVGLLSIQSDGGWWIYQATRRWLYDVVGRQVEKCMCVMHGCSLLGKRDRQRSIWNAGFQSHARSLIRVGRRRSAE